MIDRESVATPALLRAYKWDQEQSAVLREMFGAGASSSAIAAEINQRFGTAYSPNAIWVRAYAMGLRRSYTNQAVVWTDEKKEQLTELIAAGVSYSGIGEIMGFSRDAIGGQVRKLGLNQTHEESLRSRAFMRAMADVRRDGKRYALRMGKLLNWVPGKYRKEAPWVPRPEVVADPLNLTMDQVGVNQCRWIHNDDPTAPLFCGHPISRKSWCVKHAGVVFGADSPNPKDDDGARGLFGPTGPKILHKDCWGHTDQ